MPKARARALVAALAACAGCLLAGPARAEPTPEELAAARAVFAEGKNLEKRGDYAGALEKFKQVAEVKVTPQVRFHIALCEENVGKLVSALKGFKLAAEEANLAGSSAIEVSENAPRRIAALEQRVAHLHIDVTGRLVTSKLTLDGVAVPRDQIGKDQLVDPGTHVVALESDGAKSFEKQVTLAEHGSDSVTVEAHDAGPSAPAPPSVSPVVPLAAQRSRLPAYVVGGVGAASLVASGVLFGLSQAAKSDVEATCNHGTSGCDPALRSEGDRGKTFYVSGWVTGGIGAAALATGVVMFIVLSRPHARPSTQGAGLVPTFTF